ncbi:DNA-methyltransferase [Aporhodopirellula aestuarii]|uniref:Methyltransferase n=1 Tax=Aporhodopirellula aestuarii TaxID=2950107 RepID=A0ABT0UBQ9_9BACT|nr:site-specific DNA-methyltransferase [Aporhodopirellula aestuarii]MCM2374154.1 site-specific DNA-methyltransferase [Aporhodopirellula aestuarii]
MTNESTNTNDAGTTVDAVAPYQPIVMASALPEPYYDQDGITIYHGDCRDVLPMIEADLVLTDPPYGVTQQEWDSIESVRDVVASAPLAVFTTGERLLASLVEALPKQYRHIWVWDRVNHNTDFLNAARRPMRAHELIAVFSRETQYTFEPVKWKGHQVSRKTQGDNGHGTYGFAGKGKDIGKVKTDMHPRSIISVKGQKTSGVNHPTEKPVALYEYLIQSYPAEITVDPYMGSGTTLVAARNCGRRCIGIERELEHCETAVRRLAQRVLF